MAGHVMSLACTIHQWGEVQRNTTIIQDNEYCGGENIYGRATLFRNVKMFHFRSTDAFHIDRALTRSTTLRLILVLIWVYITTVK